jgi:hypothetical protein
MPYAPPRRLERIAETLVPPACAEHVLGDLAESSRSHSAYVRSLLSILPRTVWSQIRRRATLGGIVFNAAITATFLAVFLSSSPASNEPSVLLRAAAPWAMWVIGCALAAAYGRSSMRPALNPWVVVSTVVLSVVAAAAAGLPLARVGMAIGVAFGVLLLLSRPWLQRTAPAPLSLETVAEHAQLFQRHIWWRNICESIAGVVVLAANARDLVYAQAGLARAGHLLIIAGVLFIIGFLHLRAHSRKVPTHADVITLVRFHRDELARQRDLLRRMPWWYLFPFVPGTLVTSASRWQTSAGAVLLALPIIFGVFYMIWRLNVRGAGLLDIEIHKADALEVKL